MRKMIEPPRCGRVAAMLARSLTLCPQRCSAHLEDERRPADPHQAGTRALEVAGLDGVPERLVLLEWATASGGRATVDQVAQRRHDVQEDHAHGGHHHRRHHKNQAQPQRLHGGTAAAAVSRNR
jgi:hypothetical protein